MRRLPHSPEAERAVLGACLVRPQLVGELEVAASDFHDLRHQAIWGALTALAAAGAVADEIVTGEQLEREGKLQAVGGYPYLTSLTTGVLTPTNAGHHARIVAELARKRALLVGLAEIAERAAGEESYEDLAGAASALVAGLDRRTQGRARSMPELVRQRFREIDEAVEAQRRGAATSPGVPTGLARLDAALDGGLPLGYLTILGGRPAHGKSAFIANAAYHAVGEGHGVHVFSFEDLLPQNVDRLLAIASGVSSTKIRTGQLTRDEVVIVAQGAATLGTRHRLLYHDSRAMEPGQIVRAARREKESNGTTLVIVDYLQILAIPEEWRRHDRRHQIEWSVNTFAEAARIDNMAYLVVSTLNRELEKRQDKRPQLADFRECGAIEYRAKAIIGMHRPSEYGDPIAGVDYRMGESPPDPEEWKTRTDTLLLKYNFGRGRQVFRHHLDGPTTRIH